MVYEVGEDGLSVQRLETLDVAALTPLSPEVISRQATINIGTIGHVAHGKSTLVKSLSGLKTVKVKSERARPVARPLGAASAALGACAAAPGLFKNNT